MKKEKGFNVVVTIISLAIVVWLGYLAITNENLIPSRDEKLTTLRCGGQTYSIEDAKLMDVSIARTIEDVGYDEGNRFCDSLDRNILNSVIGITTKPEEELGVYRVALYRRDDNRQKSDPFNQSIYQFRFDFNAREVYFQSQFDGSWYQIGTF